MAEGTYENRKEASKVQGKNNKRKGKKIYEKLKAQVKRYIVRMGKEEGKFDEVIETYGKAGHKIVFARLMRHLIHLDSTRSHYIKLHIAKFLQ